MRIVVLPTLLALVALVASLLQGAASEEEGIRIRWKFVPGKQYVYDYADEQAFSLSDDAKEAGQGASPVGKSTGRLVIACGKDSTILTLTRTVTPLGIMATAGPTEEMITYRLLADGTCLKEGSDLDEFPGMPFFVLPRRPLSPEKPTGQGMVLQLLPEMGNPPLKGKATFTLLGRETVDGLDRVTYHTTYKLRTVRGRKTEGLDAEIEAVFAPEAGYFISVDQKLKRSHEISPKGDGTTSPVPPEWSFLINISLRLKAVEDIPDNETEEPED